MAYIDNSLGTAGGGIGDQNNIILKKNILFTSTIFPSKLQILNLINQLPSYVVNEFNNVIFNVSPQNIPDVVGYVPEIQKYLLINKGKGTYGQGGIQIEIQDLELVYHQKMTATDVEDLPTTQIVNLGWNITGTTISDFVNQVNPAIQFQSQNEGYVLIKVINNGQAESYLFTGTGGLYGFDENQTSSSNFELLDNENQPGLQPGLKEVTDVSGLSQYTDFNQTSVVALNTLFGGERESGFAYQNEDYYSNFTIRKNFLRFAQSSELIQRNAEVSFQNGELNFTISNSVDDIGYSHIYRFNRPSTNMQVYFPDNKPDGDYTIATLDDIEGNYIPLTGTEIDNPVTGNLIFDTYNLGSVEIYSNNPDNLNNTIGGLRIYDGGTTSIEHKNLDNGYSNILLVNDGGLNFSSTNPDSKGILGNEEFDKQGDRKAFAQISDVEDANIVTEYERTNKFSNFNIQGLDGAIISVGDSNLEGFYEVYTGVNNWFSKLIKEIQSYRGGNSDKGFINFGNPAIYDLTITGSTSIVTAGTANTALKMQPNSEIAFFASSKFVEIWFDKISTGGSLEFYYNDVLYRTISTNGSEINNYSFDNTQTPSEENGIYRIKCVGAETTLTVLFKSLFPEETFDNYSYMYNAIAATSFVDFDFENIRLMTGITPGRDALFLNALGINSIYSSLRGTTPEQYGIDIQNSIKILNTENSSMVYIMPPRCTEVTYPPINGAYVNFYNVAKQVCDDNGILFIDLNVVRGIYGDSIYGTDGLHYSELGHTAIYEYVSNQLSKVNLENTNLQQASLRKNQVKNGIQFTEGDFDLDVSKDGIFIASGGISAFKEGENTMNVDLSTDLMKLNVGNNSLRIRKNGESSNNSLTGGLDISAPNEGSAQKIQGNGSGVSVIKSSNPGGGFAFNEIFGNEGTNGSFWRGQYDDGIAFLWNNTPKMIRSVINGQTVSELYPDKTSRFYGSSTIDGTVSASNGTASNHLVTKSQLDANTGWANYTDTVYTSGSPFTITAGTTSTLPNNAGTVINNQLPIGITSFYNSSTNKFTPQNDGDYYITTIRFKAITTAPTAGYVDFGIDIGGALGVQFKETKIFAKGEGIEHSFSIVVPHYVGSTFVANGGLIKLTSGNGNMSIYDINFQFDRTHKAK